MNESQIIHTSLYVMRNIFDKKWSYKDNLAPNTQEQVSRDLISRLYHYSIYISVSSPNQSLYKYDFHHGITTKNLTVALFICFLGIFLMWFVIPLGVMFHSKSSVCSFTPWVIFGPLIFLCHVVTKTQISRSQCASFMMQIIIKTIKMIRNKWIKAIWTSISFTGNFLCL